MHAAPEDAQVGVHGVAQEEAEGSQKIGHAGQDHHRGQKEGEGGIGGEAQDRPTQRAEGAEHGDLSLAGRRRKEVQDQGTAQPDQSLSQGIGRQSASSERSHPGGDRRESQRQIGVEPQGYFPEFKHGLLQPDSHHQGDDHHSAIHPRRRVAQKLPASRPAVAGVSLQQPPQRHSRGRDGPRQDNPDHLSAVLSHRVQEKLRPFPDSGSPFHHSQLDGRVLEMGAVDQESGIQGKSEHP